MDNRAPDYQTMLSQHAAAPGSIMETTLAAAMFRRHPEYGALARGPLAGFKVICAFDDTPAECAAFKLLQDFEQLGNTQVVVMESYRGQPRSGCG